MWSSLNSKMLPMSQETLGIKSLRWRLQSTRSWRSSTPISPKLLHSLSYIYLLVSLASVFEPCGLAGYSGPHEIFKLLMNYRPVLMYFSPLITYCCYVSLSFPFLGLSKSLWTSRDFNLIMNFSNLL